MNKNEPLGLPRGSVRAILALLLVGSVVVFAGVSMVTGNAAPESMIGLAGMVVGYYFAKRDNDEDALPEPVLEVEL